MMPGDQDISEFPSAPTQVQYAIYERPKDFPDKFVVRKWFIDCGNPEPRPDVEPCAVTLCLEAARCVIPEGMVKINRLPNEDPVIVEVWI